MSDPLTLSDLLRQARASHAAYRASAKTRNYPLLESHLRDALAKRLEAHASDPEHTDPAWIEDQALMKGQSSQTLETFYAKYLVTP